MSNWWKGGHKKPPKAEPVSTGFVDNFVDDILKTLRHYREKPLKVSPRLLTVL